MLSSLASFIIHQSPMAPSHPTSVQVFLLLVSISFPTISATKHSHRINTLVLPVSKHASTLQYTTIVRLKTSPVPITLDLNGKFLWMSHNFSYNSSHEPVRFFKWCCGHHRCIQHDDNMHNYNNHHTTNKHRSHPIIRNVFSRMMSPGNLSDDVFSMQSTDGLNTGTLVNATVLFFAASEKLTHGLAGHSRGVVGLGRTTLTLPTQLSGFLNISRKFGVCLPPSTTDSKGVIFIGDGPYDLLPGIDISKILVYTPLIRHPRQKHHYFISVRSILVNGMRVPLRSSLLNIDRGGRGGTKISTTSPYSLLDTTIYKSLTRLFIEEALATNLTRVAPPIAPFRVCFCTKTRDEVPYRASMPVIDLVMQSKEVFWRIFETNSMIKVSEDVLCLGFLDGGLSTGASMVIGAHLLEDNFVQFDLELSRLGFSSSLLLSQTSCANFNFTSGV